MAERYRRGEHLRHPLDAKADAGPWQLLAWRSNNHGAHRIYGQVNRETGEEIIWEEARAALVAGPEGEEE
jgi:hypothetical protein